MAERIPGTCGACIAFLPEQPAAAVPEPLGSDATPNADADIKGRCHLRSELGVFSHMLRRCPKYVEKGTGARYTPPKVARPRGSKAERESDEDVVIEKARAYGPTIDLGDEGGETMDTNALKALIRDVLVDEGVLGDVPIGKRWEQGVMILKPGVEGQQSKEIPIEAFFHKIVMLRDKLRVLEQKINANTKMTDDEKVDMQQYITRCYGSLTTFNVLFRDKEQQFVGAKGE